jgi:hypothetical protein
MLNFILQVNTFRSKDEVGFKEKNKIYNNGGSEVWK